MNTAEKYNKTIALIEEYTTSTKMSAQEISDSVALASGYPTRILSDVFNYLTDTSLYKYIISRKLNAAYDYLAKDGSDISSAIDIAGYSDQPSFTKAFKNLFGITPGEVKKNKSILPNLPKPKFWDALIDDSISDIKPIDGELIMETKVFGLPESVYQKVSKAKDLESLYGFPQMFSNYAFELSERLERKLDECFQYVDSLRDYGGDYTTGFVGDDMTPEERLREAGDDKVCQKVFFERKISVSLIYELIENWNATCEELLRCNERMLKEFPGFENDTHMSFSYYIRAYEYFNRYFEIDNALDDGSTSGEGFYYDYITDILSGTPIEEAFEKIQQEIEIADDLDNIEDFGSTDDLQREYEEMERYKYIEELAAEEEYWHNKNIDDDLYYDPDNEAFYRYDREDSDIW